MNARGWMSANLAQMNASMRLPLFANTVATMRGFAQDGAYGVLTTPLDVNGWPTAACTMILSTGQLNNSAYAMKWKEGASPGFSALSGTGWSITGRTAIGGGYYTGTLVVTDRTAPITPLIGATGISEVQIMQPGLPVDYGSRWNPDALDYLAQFNGLRMMKSMGVERIPLPEGDYTLAFTGGGQVCLLNNVSTGGSTFTSGNATIPYAGHGGPIDSQVFLSGSVPPTPFVAGTPYFIIATGYGPNTMQLSATLGGAALVPTSTVSGVVVNMLEQVGGKISNAGLTPFVLSVYRGSDFLIKKVGTVSAMTVTRAGGTYRTVGTNNVLIDCVLPTTWTWANRQTEKRREASFALSREIHGMSIEECVDLANSVYARSGSSLKTAWFNIWHHADDNAQGCCGCGRVAA